MIASFFSTLIESGTQFVAFIVALVKQVFGLFYVADTGWTDIGLFVLVTVSIGVVYSVIRWVSKLIHLRG